MPTEPGSAPSRALLRPVLLGLIGGLLLAGCGAAPEHASQQAEPHVITDVGAQTLLFVEFPSLIAGEKSTFLAHWTRLDGYRPFEVGIVDVELSGGGSPSERFRIREPRRPGLFTPTVLPRATGTRQLSLRIESEGIVAVHALGDIEVFADARAAAAAPAPASPGGDIVYLKEQQWDGDFAIERVVLRPLREAVRAPARLLPAAGHAVEIVAPSAGRLRLADPLPSLGLRVKRGQRLATLVPLVGGDEDAPTLRAAFERARETARLANAEAERLRGLYAAEAVSRRRLDEALAASTVAAAEQQAAQQRLARLDGSATEGFHLLATLDGEIARASVADGAVVNAGAPLFQIIDPREVWLEISVAEVDAARLAEPDGVLITIPGRAEPLALEVGDNARRVGVGRMIDPVSRSLPVVFALDGRAIGLPLNAFVQTELYTGTRREALSVPVSAIVEDGGDRIVYVMRGGESFSRVPVRTGSRDGDRLEVLEGLVVGDFVVARGAAALRLAAATPEAMGHGHAH